jgi:hypothetical protein
MRLGIVASLMVLSGIPFSVQAQPNRNSAAVENQAAYMARCRSETIARYPNARPQADAICQSNWTQIVTAGPMADAVLLVVPQPGATFDPAQARARLTMVRWAARAQQGTVASGKLNDVDVGVTRMPALGLTFSWFKDGDTIPFNLEEALRVRGTVLTMIACLAFGSSEDTRIYRVAASGKSPFALTIARREAAVASQSSDFSAATDFSGRMPTLAALRRDGSEWTPNCPQ